MTTLLCYAIILVFATGAQVFPSLLTQVEGTAIEHGTLLSSLYLLFPLTSGAAGYLADRIGKRTVLLVGAGVMGIPFAVAATFASLWVWIGAVLLFGVGAGVLEGQASALLCDANPGRERAVLNTSQLFYSAGAAGGPFLIALAINRRPETATSLVLWLAAAMCASLVGWIALSRSPVGVAAAPAPVRLKVLVRDPIWRLLCVAIFLYVAVEAGTAGWIAKYARETLSVSASLAPVALGVFWAGLGVSRAIVGFIRLRMPDRTLLLVMTMAGLLVHVLAFLARSPGIAFALFFILGFCWGTVWPTLVSVAGRRFRSSSGAAIGLMAAAGATAIPATQFVVGWLTSILSIGPRGALLCLAIPVVANFLVIRSATASEAESGTS